MAAHGDDDHAARDHHQADGDAGRQRLPERDREDGGQRALGRGDRRDDAHLAQVHGPVHHREPRRRAGAGQDRPGPGMAGGVVRETGGRGEHRQRAQAEQHHVGKRLLRSDHARRARRDHRREPPRDRGAEAAQDRDHAKWSQPRSDRSRPSASSSRTAASPVSLPTTVTGTGNSAPSGTAASSS